MRIARLRTEADEVVIAVQHQGHYTRATGSLSGGFSDTGEPVAGELLAPVRPVDIFCIGLNYRFHAEEAKLEIPEHPVLFMKSTSSVQHPGKPIILPRKLSSDRVDYEAELAVVIGKECLNVSRDHALDYVAGYTCANDVSARDWQKLGGGGQWCRGKTFATFCPMGPVMVTSDEIRDPGTLGIRSRLNDETMQDWNTGDMIFDVPALIEFLSASTVLAPGCCHTYRDTPWRRIREKSSRLSAGRG